MIRTSVQLPREIRQLVEEQYEATMNTISASHVASIQRLLPGKISNLSRSRTAWVRDLAACANALSRFLRDSEPNDHTRRAVLAALHYLLHECDVIPDHTVGLGYVDDAHVMNLCYKQVEKRHRRLLLRHLRSARRALANAQ